MLAGSEAFVRDRPTVLSYSALGAYTFWLYAFGPALALLRSESGFSYTMLSVYSAVWAAGSALAGMTFGAAARRIGRHGMLWGSALAAAGGAAIFTATHTTTATLAGTAILGFAGTMLQTMTQSVLADRHGSRRDQALIEANIGAGASAVIAPVALGFLHTTPAGWRAGMALPALALAALYLVYRRQPLPPPPARPAIGRRGTRLSLACWLLCLLVAIGIGVEFCIVYFGAEQLSATTKLSTASAAGAMALFYAGILAGRIAGGHLARQPGRTSGLVWVSLTVTTIGFVAFWLCPYLPVTLAGLFVAGLGIANLFPLCLALALAAAPGHTDAANARSQLLGGLLVVAAPFTLGALADHVGLSAAFTVAPCLIALCALLLYLGLRSGEPAPTGAMQTPAAGHRVRS
ncbi:MFS transporter [Micromonospora sp. NBC_01412]|uniref:MFS transporter n=1 Tax=Micromonospora sp. NBC_01412 TaxID=2903590 RepID=UPI00324D88B4